MLARKRHSSGISGSESLTKSGVSSVGSGSMSGVVRVNSSGTDSTNTSFRSNVNNSFDREEGVWTETEGSHEEYSSSFKPRRFSNKSELNFRSSDGHTNLPKKKLSYIFEQSSDERLCDNKNSKSLNLSNPRSIGEKTSILESNERSYQSTETGTSLRSSGVYTNSSSNTNNLNKGSINNNNYYSNNTTHNNQYCNPHSTTFILRGNSSSDLRNLKGTGSSLPLLSSGPVNSTQSSMIDTADSRCAVRTFPMTILCYDKIPESSFKRIHWQTLTECV